MFYRDQNDKSSILKGVQIDEPMIFVPWDIDEIGFVGMFGNCNVAIVAEKNYMIKGATIWGEHHCNIGVVFDKRICKISVSRDNYEGYDDYVKSFEGFQAALTRNFGQATKHEKSFADFKNSIWEISQSITIRHYIIERFCFEEHLYIEHV